MTGPFVLSGDGRRGSGPLVRQAGRIAHLDGQRPPAGRAPWMARVNPDPSPILKNRPDGRFFALGKNYPPMSKRGRENSHRVRAGQLAVMNGRSPPEGVSHAVANDPSLITKQRKRAYRKIGPFTLSAEGGRVLTQARPVGRVARLGVMQGSLPSCLISLSSALTTLPIFFLITLAPRYLLSKTSWRASFCFSLLMVRVFGRSGFDWPNTSLQ